jgi:signal transduction histidine kinase
MLVITLAAIGLGVKYDKSDVKSITTVFLRTTSRIFKKKWMLDFVFVGMLSVALSTMDSFLHAIGILFTQDIIAPFRSFLGLHSIDKSKKITLSKAGILLIGSASLIVGFISEASLESIILWQYGGLLATIVWLPLVFGIIGIKTSEKAWVNFSGVYMISNALLHIIEKDYSPLFYDYFDECMVFSTILATLAYFITHFCRNGGIVFIKRSEQTVSEQLWLPSFSGFVARIKKWFSTPTHLSALAGRKIVQYPAQPIAFTMVMFALYTLLSALTTSQAAKNASPNLMASIQFIGVILCIGLMLQGVWPSTLKLYFPLYWFVSLFFCLPFGGTLFFLQTHEGVWHAALFVAAFLFLSAIVDVKTWCALSSMGITSATLFYRVLKGTFPQDLFLHAANQMAVLLLVILFIALFLFQRNKEAHLNGRLYWNRTASSILGHDLRSTVQILKGAGTILSTAFEQGEAVRNKAGEEGIFVGKKEADFLQDYSQTMIKKAEVASGEITSFGKFIKNQVLGILEQEEVSVLQAAREGLRRMEDRLPAHIKVHITGKEDFSAQVVAGVLPNLFYNLIANAISHGKASEVTITIDKATKTIAIRDNGSGIPSDLLPHIFDLNVTSGSKKTKNSGVGLAFVKMVVDTSNAKINCRSRHGDKASFTEFTIAFKK